jgi:hypothetical protein
MVAECYDGAKNGTEGGRKAGSPYCGHRSRVTCETLKSTLLAITSIVRSLLDIQNEGSHQGPQTWFSKRTQLSVAWGPFISKRRAV